MGLPNNCYAVNSLIGDVSGKPRKINSKSRIVLTVKVSARDRFYTNTPTAIQMSVHNPRVTLNPFKKGFTLRACSNYLIHAKKTINRLLPPPYTTNCTDYQAMWKSRGGHGPLSKTQCREECILNTSLSESRCVDPFIVSYPNMEKICDIPANTKVFARKCNNACNRGCLREDIITTVEEHASFFMKDKPVNINECTSVVTIVFNKMEVKEYAYSPKYQTIELFGYIGGYLGVWLGISLLAVTDVLESFYVVAKFFGRTLKRRTISGKKCLKKKNQLQYLHYNGKSKDNFILKIY
ncbi:degenerin mec-4-like [Uloborus diversus]|uniref:degenerin mec-4-like n=1 Tax=Uloborus diversus TaxID=327109 RepID=UPI002409DAC2|nr:degenerin mec-4-like [Uloborus diversus]